MPGPSVVRTVGLAGCSKGGRQALGGPSAAQSVAGAHQALWCLRRLGGAWRPQLLSLSEEEEAGRGGPLRPLLPDALRGVPSGVTARISVSQHRWLVAATKAAHPWAACEAQAATAAHERRLPE